MVPLRSINIFSYGYHTSNVNVNNFTSQNQLDQQTLYLQIATIMDNTYRTISRNLTSHLEMSENIWKILFFLNKFPQAELAKIFLFDMDNTVLIVLYY